jgi:hypothetical protein
VNIDTPSCKMTRYIYGESYREGCVKPLQPCCSWAGLGWLGWGEHRALYLGPWVSTALASIVSARCIQLLIYL